MLKLLAISHYAIVDQLEIELAGGMTVITGETGAGKSIMLDALGLCLGDRADSRAVRPGAKRAEISAEFAVDELPAARQWLAERELDQDNLCLLRRTISADGRSRAFINGSPSTLADCAELGALLVDIHSQHAHQSLLRADVQRQLLDAYADTTDLAAAVADAARVWRISRDEFERLSQQSDADHARRDLLAYQVEELDQLALEEDEIAALEAEQKALSNAHFLIESASRAAEGCEQQVEQLRRLRADVEDDRHADSAVANARELLASAEIQIQEAGSDLTRYADTIEIDPQRLAEVERRLELIYDLARKHRVLPENLSAHHSALQTELDSLTGDDARLERLSADIARGAADWQSLARKLTKARTKAARKLADRVMACLGDLAMERCKLTIAQQANETDDPRPHGAEKIEFLISTNPGAEPGPLAKIASGGELSRISLALQVAAAEVATSPTMVFDEVDVGIGGGTAEVVGGMLRELASRVQVICVTHLPQVAAQGQQHYKISKSGDATQVVTTVNPLSEEDRVEEIARMLGGLKITANTRSHAREMLEGIAD